MGAYRKVGIDPTRDDWKTGADGKDGYRYMGIDVIGKYGYVGTNATCV
jgi:hypothetical protein